MRLGDVSDTLASTGYFEAHGEPHFRQIREIFSFPKFGPGQNEEHLRSALLDRASSVTGMEMARQVFSEIGEGSGNNPIPILSRHDMDADRPIPEGAIDAKITTRCLV